MMTYTKKLKRNKILTSIFSYLTLLGTAITYIIILITRIGLNNTEKAVEEDNGIFTPIIEFLYPMVITFLILIVALILIGNKVRTTIWMVSTIMGCYLFGDVGIYITFGLWILDEYVLFNLSKSFKQKYIINKEIDKRE